MREIRRDPDYIDDPLLLEYLQSVWDPLVAAARRRGNITADIDQRFAWQPFLVRDPSVNAFALPGGFVGVHLGLIAITVAATSWPRCWRTRCRTCRSGTSRAASATRGALAGQPGGDDPRPAGRRRAGSPTAIRLRSSGAQAASSRAS